MEKPSYVYMMASGRYGTLYIGVTADLVRRVWQHRNHVTEGFTKTHKITHLVWFETHHDISSAITREKQLKKWQRRWKIRLVSTTNPTWQDLYPTLA